MLLCTSKGSPEPDPLQVISNISFIVVVWLSSRKPVELADFVEDRSMTTVFWMGLSTICPNRLPRLAKLPTVAWCVTPYLISGDLATLSVYQYYYQKKEDDNTDGDRNDQGKEEVVVSVCCRKKLSYSDVSIQKGSKKSGKFRWNPNYFNLGLIVLGPFRYHC